MDDSTDEDRRTQVVDVETHLGFKGHMPSPGMSSFLDPQGGEVRISAICRN